MEIDFKPKKTDVNAGESDDDVFDPMSYDGITMRCCCGYELLEESEGTMRCSGGNHRYIISKEEVEVDKFGNKLFKLPVPNDQKKDNTL